MGSNVREWHRWTIKIKSLEIVITFSTSIITLYKYTLSVYKSALITVGKNVIRYKKVANNKNTRQKFSHFLPTFFTDKVLGTGQNLLDT